MVFLIISSDPKKRKERRGEAQDMKHMEYSEAICQWRILWYGLYVHKACLEGIIAEVINLRPLDKATMYTSVRRASPSLWNERTLEVDVGITTITGFSILCYKSIAWDTLTWFATFICNW